MDQLEIVDFRNNVIVSGKTIFFQKQFLEMNGKFISADKHWIIPKQNGKTNIN